MSRQTLQEFCTTQKRPELLVEWDLERNAPLTPKDVTFGSHKKFWWCCKNGHSWQTAVYTRSGGAGCPYCSGRLPHIERSKLLSQYAPALVKEWDSEKNAPLTPSQVTVGSHRVVWWRCPKGHNYQTSVKLRVRGSGCPYCAGRAVLPEENSLAAIAPELLSEWDVEKNAPLTPEQVLAGTHRKIWWRCKKGHSWQAAAVSRIRNRTECPVCAGRKVISGENDLATVLPQLAAQWDAEKNGSLTPENVSPNSNRRVWWRCEKGHAYCAVIAYRAQSNSGCPYCTNRKVLPGFNDLATLDPAVAKEWHPTLNGALTPEMVTVGSHRKVWWQCTCGHVWKAAIYPRTGKQRCGCPVCAGRTRAKQSKPSPQRRAKHKENF